MCLSIKFKYWIYRYKISSNLCTDKVAEQNFVHNNNFRNNFISPREKVIAQGLLECRKNQIHVLSFSMDFFV